MNHVLKNRHLGLVALILLTAAISACSGNPVVKLYDGNIRSSDEIITVRTPVELEIISINDRRIEGAGTMFAYGSRDLQLLPGEYRIVAYYKNLFDLSTDQHEIVKSDPAIFFVNGNGGDIFALNFQRPENIDDARAMAKNFNGWSENLSNGDKVESKPSGLILNQGFVGLVGAASVQQPAVSNVPPATAAPINDTHTDNTASQKATTVNTGTLQSLQENWNAASAEERREFLLWMAQ